MNTLLDRLRLCLADQSRQRCEVPFVPVPFCPPATAVEVAAAEMTFGFPIPPLLRQLYLEISNGGFGPGYGLLGVPYASAGNERRAAVEQQGAARGLQYDYPDWWLAGQFADTRSIVGEHRFWSRQFGSTWPTTMVPFVYCGGTVYECVDCASAPYPVFGFDAELCHAQRPEFASISDSLAHRLEQWLLGAKLW